jgi:hypothetical protein
MRFHLLSTLLLLSIGPVAACTTSSEVADPLAGADADGGPGPTGTGGDSGATGSDAGSDGGAVSPCADQYEPLEAAKMRYRGKWLVDDSDTNLACPEGAFIELDAFPTKFDNIPPEGDGVKVQVPDDPDGNDGCPPSAFFVIKGRSLKACSQQVCWDPAGGYGFFVHALPLVPNPNLPKDPEKLMFHQADGWHRVGSETVFVDPDDPNVLHYGFGFKRQLDPVLPDGTCTPL